MAKAKEESVAGYFRKIFADHPRLLHGRSNDELLKRWLADHPNEKTVPAKVKANLSNVKSVLRKKARKGGRPKKAKADAQVATQPAAMAANEAPSPLQKLEEMIDDCLSTAKGLHRAKLHHVISLLRQARNIVVWQEGQ
jgi:hypothetical protein